MQAIYLKLFAEIYKQKEGLAMGPPLSPIIANIYMKYYNEIAIAKSSVKPAV